MKQLEEKLGYKFKDPMLLKNALTHSSYANENRAEGVPSNERLEFLGDSVLGFVTAKHLYNTISAIFLDGGIEPAASFIERMVLSPEAVKAHHASDYKTELQELVQRKPDRVLKYHEAGESGPDHDKVFLSEVSLDGEVIGRGSGRTKKEAEQAAACQALERLNK